jgi:ribosomal protein S18 acetylase RimI-like enzyme
LNPIVVAAGTAASRRTPTDIQDNSSVTVLIRIAAPIDAQTIADFQVLMAWETEQKALNRPVVEAGVTAVFDDPSRGFYLVAESGGVVVGSLLVTKEWSDWRNTDIWYIQSVYVVASHRGTGCFRQMYAATVRLAKEQGVRVLRLYVEHDNQKAQAVYERLGMTRLPYVMYQTEL